MVVVTGAVVVLVPEASELLSGHARTATAIAAQAMIAVKNSKVAPRSQHPAEYAESDERRGGHNIAPNAVAIASAVKPIKIQISQGGTRCILLISSVTRWPVRFAQPPGP